MFKSSAVPPYYHSSGIWRRQQSSHAVNNVAGSLAHVPDLAAETRAHSHTCPCPAVWHRADEFPPKEDGRGKKVSSCPFWATWKYFFSVSEIPLYSLAVYSAQKYIPLVYYYYSSGKLSAKSDWNNQKNVDSHWMKGRGQGMERRRRCLNIYKKNLVA